MGKRIVLFKAFTRRRSARGRPPGRGLRFGGEGSYGPEGLASRGPIMLRLFRHGFVTRSETHCCKL